MHTRAQPSRNLSEETAVTRLSFGIDAVSLASLGSATSASIQCRVNFTQGTKTGISGFL